jgi:hypothetical protein
MEPDPEALGPRRVVGTRSDRMHSISGGWYCRARERTRNRFGAVRVCASQSRATLCLGRAGCPHNRWRSSGCRLLVPTGCSASRTAGIAGSAWDGDGDPTSPSPLPACRPMSSVWAATSSPACACSRLQARGRTRRAALVRACPYRALSDPRRWGGWAATQGCMMAVQPCAAAADQCCQVVLWPWAAAHGCVAVQPRRQCAYARRSIAACAVPAGGGAWL